MSGKLCSSGTQVDDEVLFFRVNIVLNGALLEYVEISKIAKIKFKK